MQTLIILLFTKFSTQITQHSNVDVWLRQVIELDPLSLRKCTRMGPCRLSPFAHVHMTHLSPSSFRNDEKRLGTWGDNMTATVGLPLYSLWSNKPIMDHVSITVFVNKLYIGITYSFYILSSCNYSLYSIYIYHRIFVYVISNVKINCEEASCIWWIHTSSTIFFTSLLFSDFLQYLSKSPRVGLFLQRVDWSECKNGY